MSIPTEQLAYWAGFFDGEGSIQCTRVKGSNGIHFSCSVSQCGPTVVKEIHAEFGGHMYLRTRSSAKHRSCWQLSMSGKRGECFLKAILPYLQEKKEEAELALAVRETMDWKNQRKGRPKTECLPPEMVAFRNKSVERIRLLKHRESA